MGDTISAMPQALDVASSTAMVPLGTRMSRVHVVAGHPLVANYVYCVSGAATTSGDYLSYNTDTPYEVQDGYTATTMKSMAAGIGMVATTAAGQYFWVLESGVWKDSALTTTGNMRAAAATGTTTSASAGDDATNIGIVTGDDVAILWDPGRSGAV